MSAFESMSKTCTFTILLIYKSLQKLNAAERIPNLSGKFQKALELLYSIWV